MRNIVLLNGSPRINGSTSMKLLESLKSRFDSDCTTTILEAGKSILHNTQLQDYDNMVKADVIVIAFPLYVYCLPGVLIEFLSGYRDYVSSNGKSVTQKIYAIINCGFPESRINDDAALVIKNICKEIGAEYHFSIMIGGGGMLQPMKKFPPVHRMWKYIGLALDQIVRDVCGENTYTDIHIDSQIPKRLFYFIAQTNFTVVARMSGMKKKEIFRRPYLLNETANEQM